MLSKTKNKNMDANKVEDVIMVPRLSKSQQIENTGYKSLVDDSSKKKGLTRQLFKPDDMNKMCKELWTNNANSGDDVSFKFTHYQKKISEKISSKNLSELQTDTQS